MFKPGQSGNPGGRPKIEKKIRDRWDALAKSVGQDDAVSEWVAFVRGVMMNSEYPPRARLAAAKLLKEAAYGAPLQTIAIEDEPALTPEEYAAELAEIAREHLAKLSPEEKLRLLADPAHADTIQ